VSRSRSRRKTKGSVRTTAAPQTPAKGHTKQRMADAPITGATGQHCFRVFTDLEARIGGFCGSRTDVRTSSDCEIGRLSAVVFPPSVQQLLHPNSGQSHISPPGRAMQYPSTESSRPGVRLWRLRREPEPVKLKGAGRSVQGSPGPRARPRRSNTTAAEFAPRRSSRRQLEPGNDWDAEASSSPGSPNRFPSRCPTT